MKDPPKIFRGSINRVNLCYRVIEKPGTKQRTHELLLEMLENEFDGETGIIYATTIKECNDTFEYLSLNEVSCLPYHGHIAADIREKTQKKWLEDKCQVIVSTVAFGLGIDKPDVSFVIHQSSSQSIQNYYQESGIFFGIF